MERMAAFEARRFLRVWKKTINLKWPARSLSQILWGFDS